MKTQKLLTLVSTTAALVTYTQAAEPSIPIGKLHIDATVVVPNVIPNLSWEITHPIDVTDVVDIDENTDTVTTTKKVLVKVSMIGTGITDRRGNEYDSVSEIKFGTGPWEHIFTGPGRAVDTTDILIEKEVEPGVKIQFRSRYTGYDEWIYNSSSEIQVLTKGQKPPSNPASDELATSAEKYMQDYSQGPDGTLSIGDLDIIYAAELTHTDTSSSGYDMQDSIVLVSFSDIETQIGSAKGEAMDKVNGGKSNNGHGNNIDGIDVSNPGEGQGGPNGELDTDYDGDGTYEDDEGKGGKKSNREYTKGTKNEHDYSDYDTSKGCGYAGGGKPKDRSHRKDHEKDQAKKKGRKNH
ncbi:MAG: hypothetical protein ABGY95_11050 [Rubritalea sp.]|uniref:hypothetical protein n=1 Tax=Rubritalea sp. TaxID=2109375 RepID=UPI0032421AE0